MSTANMLCLGFDSGSGTKCSENFSFKFLNLWANFFQSLAFVKFRQFWFNSAGLGKGDGLSYVSETNAGMKISCAKFAVDIFKAYLATFCNAEIALATSKLYLQIDCKLVTKRPCVQFGLIGAKVGILPKYSTFTANPSLQRKA